MFDHIVAALCNLPRGESQMFRSKSDPRRSVTASRVMMGIQVEGVLFSDEAMAAATIYTALVGE